MTGRHSIREMATLLWANDALTMSQLPEYKKEEYMGYSPTVRVSDLLTVYPELAADFCEEHANAGVEAWFAERVVRAAEFARNVDAYDDLRSLLPQVAGETNNKEED